MGETTDEFAHRAGHNQALFREINERLRELAEGADEPGTWNCECTDVTCLAQIEMSLAEYDAVRARATWFVVRPDEDHVVPDVERVVRRTPGYWIVEKLGEAGDTAAVLDPR
jgi:hypothetical protein